MGYKVLRSILSRGNIKRYLVEFSYKPKKKQSIYTVYLLGSFNSWSMNTPMRKEGDRWIVRVSLREGLHRYLFWINNFKAVLDEENPNVGEWLNHKVSCILLLDKKIRQSMGVLGDGEICEEALYHDQSILYLSAPSEHILTVRFRTLKGDVERVLLHYGWNNESNTQEMSLLCSDEFFDYYECTVTAPAPIHYYFEVIDGSSKIYYMNDCISKEKRVRGNKLFKIDSKELYSKFSLPEWAKFSVFYEIMPDRFFNGDPLNDPPKVRKWGKPPKPSSAYGGDLKGILLKLPYLKDLGVDAIYLTPLFKSPSFHKYDVRDFFSVDECFGDEESFATLVKEAHKNGIKVIIDGVFHHCGFSFEYFQDVVKNGQVSKYSNWFVIYKFPVFPFRYKILNAVTRILPFELRWKIRARFSPPYESFLRNYEVPRFNYNSNDVWNFILRVAEYWVKNFDIDGWRLDVAHGIPPQFWKIFRDKMKAIKPSIFIFGEVIFYSPLWFEEGCFDGATNYDLYNLVKAFFAEGSMGVRDFEKGLARLRFLQPPPYCFFMFNFLDNHDVSRFLSLCKGDKRKVKLALIFLFTYIGIPSFFYGDEVGITGKSMHGCRATMIWDERLWDADLRSFYKTLISLRKMEPLVTGMYKTILVNDEKNLLIYKRELGDDRVIVVLNNCSRGYKLEFDVDPGLYYDVFERATVNGENGKLRISLRPYEGKVLVLSSRGQNSRNAEDHNY